jgi:hypothetical protein
MMVGAAGQMLERSIVDRMVGASERLVFEGPPVLQPPLVQDAEKRRPVVTEGEVIDTLAVCAPLTLVEQQALRKLRAEAKQNLLPESNRVREAYIADQAQRLAARTGVTLNAAKRVIEQQCKGVLLADVVLPFDDPDMTTITVAHVLDDPAHFEGMTLADPIEGVEYGHCKAKIMRRSDGTPWINSFAHGHATYELKYDARAVSARVAQAENKVDAFVRSALLADLDEAETHQLVDQVHRLTGIGIRVITATLKAAKKEKNHQRMEEIRERKLAERTDPRTQVLNPPTEEPYAPVMKTLNEAAMLAPRSSRNKRDVDGERVRARLIKIPKMHQFKTSNAEEES